MWDLLKEIDWNDSGWKIAFFIVLVIFLTGLYHAVKFAAKQLVELISELKTLTAKMDTRITIVENRVEKHDEHIDMLMNSLLKATRK